MDRINDFIPKIAAILQRYHVNALNISIRHANNDPGSVMAWAKEEVFAFVLYYKQATNEPAKEKVALWTRELIDAAISVGGSYYLPYQLHATLEQLKMCYPRLDEFIAIKNKYDPDARFTNKLWQKYLVKNEEEAKMPDNHSLFKSVYSETEWRDKFFLFLQNIYNLYPEDKFHHLIKETTAASPDDESIYNQIQLRLKEIKPFLAPIRYAIPALIKQKKEIANQTLEILGKVDVINGYVEIGSTGRYISKLKKHLKINGPIYLINDVEPGYSPVDMVERGSIFKIGQYVPMGNYESHQFEVIPDGSVDLVTCYVGLHHVPLDKLDGYVKMIHRILRPGGRFIIRDHNVDSVAMRNYVGLVHAVFNAGLGVSWELNTKELRYFTSNEELSSMLKKSGFHDTGKRILQKYDPSLNTLMEFIKE